jgi:Gti1/Pac2 family transcription factor
MNSTSELDATYYGFIGSTYDALILFEACIAGQIKHVSRRPQNHERERVIQSGGIFIYEENTSGIKRWTDGISWSPSRILGNFLIYRQLVKAFEPGEKRKAIKRSKAGPSSISKSGPNNNKSRNKENNFQVVNSLQAISGTNSRASTIKPETERALIGSLADSYDFLGDGLVKKTISVNYGEVTHHLVSYYTISDAISQKFLVPSKDPRFAGTYPRASLLTSQNFRNAIEGIDPMDCPTYTQNIYEMTTQGFLQHQIPRIPDFDHYSRNGETANKLYNSNYALPIASSAYEHGLPAYILTGSYSNHHLTARGNYPTTQRPEDYQGDKNQHFALTGASNSEAIRESMPTAGNQQRDVSFLHRRDSEDSGVSMPTDKIVNDLNFSQNSFYGVSQGVILTTDSLAVQKTLPSSPQADFTGQVAYEGLLSNGQKNRIAISLDNAGMWLLGNVSAGHGHYQNV